MVQLEAGESLRSLKPHFSGLCTLYYNISKNLNLQEYKHYTNNKLEGVSLGL